MERTSIVGVPEDALGGRSVLKLSVPEQMQELQAALSLNKSQLLRVLQVSRPALYDWFRGKEPNPANAGRLHALLRCLSRARVSGASPLNARFVRRPADLDGPAVARSAVRRADRRRSCGRRDRTGAGARRDGEPKEGRPRRTATRTRLRRSRT